MSNKTDDKFTIVENMRYDEVYAIMEQAFPASEMRAYKGQRELLSYDDYKLYGVKDENDKIYAFMATWEPDNFLFLEHFAVLKAFRNGGTGGRLLADFLNEKGLPMVLEVEKPDTEMAKRRINFYERLGFALNYYDYVLPPFQKGQKPLPLYIMTYPNAIDEKQFMVYQQYLSKVVQQAGL